MATSLDPKSSPLARDRRHQILNELELIGAVRVTALARRFLVAEETIRRDLDKLGASQLLVRTHGGAISIRSDRRDLPIAVRKTTFQEEKRRIAQHAVAQIKAGDVIALDASSTVLELAYQLPDMRLTVVTHGLDVARLLMDKPQIEVVVTGGQVDAASASLLGPVAEQTLATFAVNKAFLSCKAVDFKHGLSEATIAHASIKKTMLDLAEQSFLLADPSKFGVRSVAYFGSLQSIDVVIADETTDAEVLNALQEAGVEVKVATSKNLLPESN